MPPRTTSKAPAHLARATRAWWLAVTSAYELEEHHLRLLAMACESFDRCTQARRAIQKHGITFEDRLGVPRARPEVAIERDSRIAFSRLLRELDLDVQPPADAYPRSPALLSNRRAAAARRA